MRRRSGFAVVTLALSLLMGACAASERRAVETTDPTVTTTGSTSATTTTSTTTTTTTAAPTTTTIAAPTTTIPEITVVATDYRYEGLPETVPVGTRVSLVNESSAEFHEMAIVKLNDSETRPVEELSQLPFEELHYRGIEIGSIRSVVFAMPESPQYTFVLGPPAFGGPGRYIVFCSILVGADPERARTAVERGPMHSVEGVPRHYEVGMMTEVIVEG